MNKKQLLTAISLLTMTGVAGHANAATAVRLSSGANPFQRCEATQKSSQAVADCACQAALDNGSAQVLQSFFSIYAKDAPSTACAALASTVPLTSTGQGGESPSAKGHGGNNYH